MRIISGCARGLKLKAPRGMSTRPTADRIKESLFNILTCMLDFDGRRVLDLFSGSGALGLESLSRGAAHVTMIDHHSTDCIADNLRRSKLNDATILRADVLRALERLSDQQFDLIFIDPPYHQRLAQRTVDLVTTHRLLSTDGVLSVELGVDETIIAPTLERVRRVEYGRTTAIEIFKLETE